MPLASRLVGRGRKGSVLQSNVQQAVYR